MIKIVAVGKVKEKALQSLIDEYLKRLKPIAKIEIIEVQEQIAPQTNSDAQNADVLKKEGEALLSKVKKEDVVITLDLHGKVFDSIAFAQKIQSIQTYQTPDITFVIGGSLGLSPAVVERSDIRWKLSDLTFPHQMCRYLLVEQLYRAYKILRNEPYHK